MCIDSADESLPRDEFDEVDGPIYDLLVELEKRGWDGLSGLD